MKFLKEPKQTKSYSVTVFDFKARVKDIGHKKVLYISIQAWKMLQLFVLLSKGYGASYFNWDLFLAFL